MNSRGEASWRGKSLGTRRAPFLWSAARSSHVPFGPVHNTRFMRLPLARKMGVVIVPDAHPFAPRAAPARSNGPFRVRPARECDYPSRVATTRRDADARPPLRRSKSFDPLTRTIEPGPRARTARSSRVCEAPRFARFLLKLANGKLTTRGLMIGASDSSFPGSQSPSRYLRHAQCAGWRASTVEE